MAETDVMSGAPAIEASGLSKSFVDWRRRRNVAVDGVSLRVERGQIFGLLGQNGAGKTTLVKLLLGLAIPDHGGGQLLGHPLRNAAARKRIGFLPESMRLPDYMKGPSFLRYMGRLNDVEAATLNRRIPELLEKMGLLGVRTLLRGYSKGMQQRLGLAQALINDPDLLFLDEPSEGLDPLGRKQVRDMLQELRTQGKTIFLNSHLLSEVELVCDRVAIMNRGRVVREGSPLEMTAAGGEYRVRISSVTPAAQSAFDGDAARWEANAALFRPRDRGHLNQVIDRLRAAGIEIESVEPVRSTLEESFIQIVAEEAK